MGDIVWISFLLPQLEWKQNSGRRFSVELKSVLAERKFRHFYFWSFLSSGNSVIVFAFGHFC